MIDFNRPPKASAAKRRVRSLIAPPAAKTFDGETAARGRIGDWRADAEFPSPNPPDCFWVGCSDYPAASDSAAFPSSKIISHDNIANLVAATDINCLSAMQYAVEVGSVKTIVVVGHHGCRGVAAAIENQPFDVLSSWLRPVARLARKYQFLLEQIQNNSDRLDALCELNVIEQVHAACRTTVVQSAWINGCKISVSGLIYDSQDRLLENFQFSIGGNDSLPAEEAEAIEALARRWDVRFKG